MAVSIPVPETAPTAPEDEARRAVSVTLGGLRLRFEAADGLRLASPPDDVYGPFLDRDPGPPSTPADLTLVVRDDAPPAADGALRFDTGDAWTLHAHRGGYLVRLGAPGQPEALWTAVLDPALERGVVHAGPALRGGTGLIRHLVQYPLDQILAMLLLGARGGVLLHAAACIVSGRALVFPGVSGAGKSTLTRTVGDGDGVRWLSDDRVIVRAGAAGLVVHGTPWPGDARIARNACAPLAALGFPDRSERAISRPLARGEALRRLLPTASLGWFDARLVDQGLGICERLLGGHPAYAFGFALDTSRARAALRALLDGPG